MFLTNTKFLWTTLKMSSLFKGSSAHILKDQERDPKKTHFTLCYMCVT